MIEWINGTASVRADENRNSGKPLYRHGHPAAAGMGCAFPPANSVEADCARGLK